MEDTFEEFCFVAKVSLEVEPVLKEDERLRVVAIGADEWNGLEGAGSGLHIGAIGWQVGREFIVQLEAYVSFIQLFEKQVCVGFECRGFKIFCELLPDVVNRMHNRTLTVEQVDGRPTGIPRSKRLPGRKYAT